MKKFLNNILSIIIIFFISINFDYYSTIGRVVGYDSISDTLYIKSDNNLWEYDGIEDWMIDDYCSIVFCDNGTESISDDEIVYIRYIGYLERGE